ncbi:MAG: NAD(P)-dependent oxidoreductase [Candidatus Omnitrophica bacterium]|nr:NAD(P)-dependent oxidoreductase [Candidatus Omnitrophota bacterium]
MLTHASEAPSRPRRVVVLGASGFVGADLIEHLRGHEVPTLPLSSADVDLRQAESVERLVQLVDEGDSLVIVSALTPDKGKDVKTFMANLTMGAHVSAFLSRVRLAQVVYVSSDSVYDDQASLIDETTRCAPQTFHGLMHLARERMVTSALQPLKTPLLIIRPSLLYGARDSHNGYGPNRFLRSAREEARIELFGQGEETRDHVYIKDLSRLIGLGLLHGSQGVLNVATGQSVSFRKVAELVASMADHPVWIECRPRTGPISHRHFDIKTLLSRFPTFRLTPLQEGLADTLRQMKASAEKTMPIAV